MDRKRLLALLKYLVSKLWSYDSRVPGLDALDGKPTKSTILISLLVIKWVMGNKVCIMENLDNAGSYSQSKPRHRMYGITCILSQNMMTLFSVESARLLSC